MKAISAFHSHSFGIYRLVSLVLNQVIPYLILRIFYDCTLVQQFSPILGELGIHAAYLRHATLKEFIIWVVEITFLAF